MVVHLLQNKVDKKKLLKKYLRFFTKYLLFEEKDLLGKKFYNEKFFYWKKTFFTEEDINENVKNIYISFQKYIFTQKMLNFF